MLRPEQSAPDAPPTVLRNNTTILIIEHPIVSFWRQGMTKPESHRIARRGPSNKEKGIVVMSPEVALFLQDRLWR